MLEFIECVECGFVLLAETPSDPIPKRREVCPDCGGTDFAFTEE